MSLWSVELRRVHWRQGEGQDRQGDRAQGRQEWQRRRRQVKGRQDETRLADYARKALGQKTRPKELDIGDEQQAAQSRLVGRF